MSESNDWSDPRFETRVYGILVVVQTWLVMGEPNSCPGDWKAVT